MKYTAPDFFVEEFQLNDSIAWCASSTVTADVAVKVSCTISGSHWIFYDACEQRSEGADYEECAIVKYNNNEYLIWAKNGNMIPGVYDAGTGQNLSGQGLLSVLVAAYNAQTSGTDYSWNNVHGGLITPEVTSVRNSSI